MPRLRTPLLAAALALAPAAAAQSGGPATGALELSATFGDGDPYGLLPVVLYRPDGTVDSLRVRVDGTAALTGLPPGLYLAQFGASPDLEVVEVAAGDTAAAAYVYTPPDVSLYPPPLYDYANPVSSAEQAVRERRRRETAVAETVASVLALNAAATDARPSLADFPGPPYEVRTSAPLDDVVQAVHRASRQAPGQPRRALPPARFFTVEGDGVHRARLLAPVYAKHRSNDPRVTRTTYMVAEAAPGACRAVHLDWLQESKGRRERTWRPDDRHVEPPPHVERAAVAFAAFADDAPC